MFAIISAVNTEKGFYRSDDHGATWTKLVELHRRRSGVLLRDLRRPEAPDTIWSVNTQLEWSRDGGKTFTAGVEHGERRRGGAVRPRRSPRREFDPGDRNHVIIGNDGGLYETYDADQLGVGAGAHWRFFTNLPITQFYRVSVDKEQPF